MAAQICILGIDLDADPVPSVLLRYQAHGPGPEERVKRHSPDRLSVASTSDQVAGLAERVPKLVKAHHIAIVLIAAR
jgi:hypothetical protein